MAGRFSAELAFVAGETYVGLDSERRTFWDDLSAQVEKIVFDEVESVSRTSVVSWFESMRQARRAA